MNVLRGGSWAGKGSQEISISEISPDCCRGAGEGDTTSCLDPVTSIKEGAFLVLISFLWKRKFSPLSPLEDKLL